MVNATVFITTVTAVRKTANDCRRLQSLLSALKIEYELVNVDTKEMRQYVEELAAKAKGASETTPIELPLCFVAERLIGDYDTIESLNEEGKIPITFRAVGYSGTVFGGENIPVGNSGPSNATNAAPKPPPEVKKVVKKVIVKRKKTKEAADGDGEDADVGPSEVAEEEESADAPPPPPPEDEEDDLPPPPADDDDIDIDAVEADLPPPPPPGEEGDEDDLPPPPPVEDDEDMPPPPPPEDEE